MENVREKFSTRKTEETRQELSKAGGSYSGLFTEKGLHIFEPNRNKINTKVSIDFFEEVVKIYIVLPKKSKKDTKPDSAKETDEKLIDITRNERIIYKKFKIAEDYKSVTIDGVVYIIPEFFNKEMIKQEDVKTWQIIFYQIFNNEVTKALSVHKNLQKEKMKKENNELQE